MTNVYIHDNLFTNNGTDPTGDFGQLFNALGYGGDGNPPVPDVVWDAYTALACDSASDNTGDICFTDEQCPNGACALVGDDPGICLGTDETAAPSVLTIGDPCQDLSIPNIPAYIACAFEFSSTDQTPYLCAP